MTAGSAAASHTCGQQTGAFRLDDWTVAPALDRLSRGEQVVHLRPKVMDVLVLLAGRAGEVVAKNEIVDAIWAKEFLADTALARAVSELRDALGDDAQSPRYIETIPKRGYRLISPVSLSDTATGEPGATPGPGRRLLRRATGVGGSCVTAFVLTLVAAVGRPGHHSALAAQPAVQRIAVLPFENVGDPGDAFLAGGLAEEIRTRLVSADRIAVIARSSAEHLAGVGRSEKQIGDALTADYVLAGTIRWDRSGGRGPRVRITPRLVRVADGAQVWATAYDGTVQDALRVQAEVAANVVTAVGVRLSRSARDNIMRVGTTNGAAHEAFLRGLYHADNAYRPEPDLRLGLQMYERAVQLDPNYAAAWSLLSITRSSMYHIGSDRTERCREEARRAAERALELAPDLPVAHLSMGLYRYRCERDWQRALDEYTVAGRGRGGLATIKQPQAYVLRRLGRWDEALTLFAQAQALNPMEPGVEQEWGLTSLSIRAYEQAEQHFRRAIGLGPDLTASYVFLAQTYWLRDGDLGRARQVLDAIPRPSDPWAVYWLFWQDLFEGRFEAARGRALAAKPLVVTNHAMTNGLVWDSRDMMLGRAYSLLGRPAEARLAFEAARAELESRLRERPDDFALHGAMGLALSGLGRHGEAIAAGRTAAELMRLTSDAVDGTGPLLALAEILTAAGRPEDACGHLETLLSVPSGVTVPLLRIDPRWAPLRSQPCFAALLARHPETGRPASQVVASVRTF